MKSLATFSIITMLCLFQFIGIAQSPSFVGYQAVVRDVGGAILVSSAVDVQFGILQTSTAGVLLYEETQSVTTNSVGLIDLNIGNGTSTGAGSFSNMSSVNWGADQHYLNVKIDVGSTGSFIDIGTTQLMSVPYAFHSKTTDQVYALNELTDVDTSGLEVGHTLIWNGVSWVAGNVDSVSYAVNSGSANFADTAAYAISSGSAVADTAQFSYWADSSNFSWNSQFVNQADSSNYSDTSLYALSCLNSWDLNGNALTGVEFIGSTNAQDVVVRTNNIERMRLTSTGKIGINTPVPVADFELTGDDGMMVHGTLGSGIAQSFTGDRLVWYPRKAHFYSGGGSIALNDGNIGDYSFGSGYNVTPSGDYATVFGYACLAQGEASFATGYDSKAFGDYSFAQGHVSTANGEASIAMGRGAISSGMASVALGYHPQALADYSVAIGNRCYSTAESSYSFGYFARSNHSGTFVYADQTAGALSSTADNQFMVRAAGGTIFYSATDLSSGVALTNGAGAWATISDSTKKENISPINGYEILAKIQDLDVYNWNYKTQDSVIRHVGPMAQDFYKSFGFGESDTTITTTDIDGVNLAALKALNEKSILLEESVRKFDALWMKYEALKKEKENIIERLDTIESNLYKEVVESKR